MSAAAAAAVPAYARADGINSHWNQKRARTVRARTGGSDGGSVAYWMARDQRAHDNWALIHAQQLALSAKAPLHVCFCLPDDAGGLTRRHAEFLLGGLADVESALRELDIPFHLLRGGASTEVPEFVRAHGIGTLVCDFSPLRAPRAAQSAVVDALPASVGVIEVDAHNVVPCWVASEKQEVGARTLRPKIERALPTFLTEFPALERHPHAPSGAAPAPLCWDTERARLSVDESVRPVDWIVPGERAAHAALATFLKERLKLFAAKRNDPNVHATSDLSPYLNFGQLAPQRAALVVRAARAHNESVKSYIEESVVRRELSDNYCYYNPNYDSLAGAAGWARESLEKHASDAREWRYSLEELEGAQTHEDIWNAAQRQLSRTGKMHGFMRMYWAKKILEWTDSPAEALGIAQHLNDKLALDGNDPNGFVGVGWSIMGVHDMGWAERAVFGKIRYMNYNGCKRKFDVAAFAKAWPAEGDAGKSPAKPSKGAAGRVDKYFEPSPKAGPAAKKARKSK